MENILIRCDKDDLIICSILYGQPFNKHQLYLFPQQMLLFSRIKLKGEKSMCIISTAMNSDKAFLLHPLKAGDNLQSKGEDMVNGESQLTGFSEDHQLISPHLTNYTLYRILL